jgi:hypothetical protein
MHIHFQSSGVCACARAHEVPASKANEKTMQFNYADEEGRGTEGLDHLKAEGKRLDFFVDCWISVYPFSATC